MSRYGHIDKNMEPTYTEHEGTISFPVPGAPQGIAEEAPGDHQIKPYGRKKGTYGQHQ